MAGVLIVAGVGSPVVAGVGAVSVIRHWSSIVARGAEVRVSLVVMSFV
jgi:hypothetical protein